MLFAIGISLIGLSLPLAATTIKTEIQGVEGAMLDNVRASLSLVRAEALEEISVWRARQMAEDATGEAQRALQPFGYYRANVSVRLEEPEDENGQWLAIIEIQPGEPVRIGDVDVRVSGNEDALAELIDWQNNWPLPEGSILHHARYQEHLRALDFLAEAHGFYQGRFVTRRIEVDPIQNLAAVDVHYEAGTRYSIGQIDFSEVAFSEKLMQRMTILEPGQYFHTRDIDRQREVLARSAYFEQITIDRARDDENHEVDLTYQLKKRSPNTYRALVGFGTDTGARMQLGWTRHYLSERGDRLDMRLGAQQTDSEFIFRTQYEHPFGHRPMNFFNAEAFLRRERERFRFQDDNSVESVFDSFSGTRNQAQLTIGRNREYDLAGERVEHAFDAVIVLKTKALTLTA
ncbi:MAG: POTRA domain-containing protein [Pseudomonadota bacterium]